MSCQEDKEWLVEYLHILWNDIHFNREQSWRILMGPFISVLAMLAAAIYEAPSQSGSSGLITKLAAIIAIVFSLAGLLITMRHRKLFIAKRKAISCIERWLELDCINRIIALSRTSIPVNFIIINLYLVFISISLGLVLYGLTPNNALPALASIIVYIFSANVIREVLKKWEDEVEKKAKCPHLLAECSSV
jgi:ABC-type bacteriocin/lantibiotic exporter with double-glycine peptidase domain